MRRPAAGLTHSAIDCWPDRPGFPWATAGTRRQVRLLAVEEQLLAQSGWPGQVGNLQSVAAFEPVGGVCGDELLMIATGQAAFFITGRGYTQSSTMMTV